MTDFKHIGPTSLLRHNASRADFEGLSPNEIHYLLYATYADISCLKIQKNIDDLTLDRIPFFRLTEEFLKNIQRNGRIELAPPGALPKNIVHELYSHRFIIDERIEGGFTKLNGEDDCISIKTLHVNTLLIGAIEKMNNRLFLTKKGQELLQRGSRVELFRQTLMAFTDKFNWASHDRYPREPVGQLGWGYIMYLLSKYGNTERPVEFYIHKYLRAFPGTLDAFAVSLPGAASTLFESCFAIRTHERFLSWFGFVRTEYAKDLFEPSLHKIVRSEVMERVFDFVWNKHWDVTCPALLFMLFFDSFKV